eukprot:15940-Heterococcus_DN1.PRE.2
MPHRLGVTDGRESIEADAIAALTTAVKGVTTPTTIKAGDAAMALLPQQCVQSLAVQIRGAQVLVLGTSLTGNGIWSESDLVWIQRLAGYLGQS